MTTLTEKPVTTATDLHPLGAITPGKMVFTEPLALSSGRTLDHYNIIYETYGELNADKSNAVLICHALTGDHHAAGFRADSNIDLAKQKPGWWDNCIGPGKPIDTNRFFVVSINNLGGCSGSTGPTSINPETGIEYGPDFPLLTVRDWVNSQHRVMQRLDLSSWAAVIGGSLGGMQALQWAIDFPDLVRNTAIIAAAPKLSAQNIAFNEVARQAIRTDPQFHAGRYTQHGVVPETGLKIARMLGHITYLSDESMRKKFGRELRIESLQYSYDVEFEVESYLRYQGQQFVQRFDANSYLLLTKILDYFDPAKDFNDDLAAACTQIQAKALVISFSRDWRFAPSRSREIVKAMLDADRDVCYAEIEAELGHDDFLMPIPQYLQVFGAFMQGITL